jgi:hypothetical protein
MIAQDSPPRPPPFWHRLNSFFAFPLQLRPLAYGLVLSFCSLLFEAVFFLPDALAFIVIEIGIMLAASRYGFKITALGARGIWQSADFGASRATSGPTCRGSSLPSRWCRAP